MEWNASVGIPLIIIGAIVLLLIYLFGGRFFVRGLTSGAVK